MSVLVSVVILQSKILLGGDGLEIVSSFCHELTFLFKFANTMNAYNSVAHFKLSSLYFMMVKTLPWSLHSC